MLKETSGKLFPILCFVFLWISPCQAQGQTQGQAQTGRNKTSAFPASGKTLQWDIGKHQLTEDLTLRFLTCTDAINDPARNHWPVWGITQKMGAKVSEAEVILKDMRFEVLNTEEQAVLHAVSSLPEQISPRLVVSQHQKRSFALLSFVPLRRNPSNGQIEKLVGFDYDIRPTARNYTPHAVAKSITNSVLAQGTFYKIGITKDGIYRLDHDFLTAMGIDLTQYASDDINIYGNHFGMLPESNAAYRPDDLKKNRIQVVDGGDGTLDQGDYLLFYAKGPDKWIYNNGVGRFEHQTHLYSDTAFLFVGLGTGDAPGRITNRTSAQAPATRSVTTFDDYRYHEIDSRNLIKSGRVWFGEEFSNLTDRHSFNFIFPELDQTSTVTVKTNLAAKTIGSSLSSSFDLNVNGTPATASLSISGVGTGYTADAARPGSLVHTFLPNSNVINVGLTFQYHSGTSVGWLNYIEVLARRNLRFADQTDVTFRDINSIGIGEVAEYTISDASSVLEVWEITDPTDVHRMVTTDNGNAKTFRLESDSLREFFAFTAASYRQPVFSGVVANQNLHAFHGVDYVMVTHPAFLAATNALAVHRRNQGHAVEVVTTDQVYNEFSSGMADITAIKDLMRMLYNRAGTDPAQLPKYLLLVGDGSYDNKNRIFGNTAFIPTYQSPNSWSVLFSYVSDDYFGFLDPTESASTVDLLDIGIGRLPVSKAEDAQGVVDKIMGYDRTGTTLNPDGTVCDASESLTAFGDWRNRVTIVADDEDNNTHVGDAEAHSQDITSTNPEFLIEKMYLDAYKQEATPGGERYPQVAELLNKRVEQGVLILNYIGHGGEVGWAHERILSVPVIQNWSNIRSLPLFLTATCEFSRFDDPGRTAAGEYVLLNKDGGAIALMTTTRLVFSSPNFALNNKFYEYCFLEPGGTRQRLGDINRLTKIGVASTGSNRRNFSLLGDPATQLAYPWYDVVTTTINGQAVGAVQDTLKALSSVTVQGFIADKNGDKMNGFNGVLYPTVHDKPSTLTTLGQNSGSGEMNFNMFKNVIYKGKVSVVKGDFSFTFMVPKDISYQFGPGRISYYAENAVSDAHGYNSQFIVGGSADTIKDDQQGPDIELYMNNENFTDGGITNETPTLFAKVFDQNGINMLGNGIGHDIIAILDGKTDRSIVLNEFYESDLDSYQSGQIRYKFGSLSEGNHNLKIKVWDVYNNSSEASIDFVVKDSENLTLAHVLNYPNPFTTNTAFYFEHNQVCEFLDVEIDVFTVSGKVVKSIHQTIRTDGFKVSPIAWDGRDEFGDNLGRGVYVYRVKVLAEDGSKAEEFEKLVILK